MESVIDSLHDILADVEIDADFATFGLLDEAANPGLHVEGLGNIELPVSQRDLEALISKSKQSGFGFKSETRIDLNVRKTWEIQADQVRFDHPSWPARLRKIVDHVSTALRVPMGVEAKLNKLLIYEKGGKFDKHKDSEKEEGMFGTLAITLPMKHTGGDLLLEHLGTEKVFQSAPTSSHRISVMAWYADVSHQVRKVETGNRIVLTYNLIHARGVTGLSAGEQYSDLSTESDLHQLLTELKKLPGAKKLLAYQLDHEYTEANMRLDHLKGLDRNRCEMLYSAAKASDFRMFLASMEKSIYGGCDGEDDYYGSYDDESDGNESEDDESEDNKPGYGKPNSKTSDDEESDDDENGGDYHKIIDVCDETLSLRRVFDLDGHELAKDVEINEDQVVQGKKAFRTIDEEDYSGWTGNEGVSATHYYRSTVMVLIPRAHEVEAFFESALRAGGIDKWLREMTEEYRGAGPNQKTMISANLESLVNLVLQNSSYAVRPFQFQIFLPSYGEKIQKELGGSTFNLAMMAALAMDNDELLLKVLRDCKQARPSMWHILGCAIHAKVVSSTQTNFAEALEPYDLQAVADILAQLNNALQGRELSNDNNLVKPAHSLVQNYLQITMERRLETEYRPTRKDGIALATLCSWFANLLETTFSHFVLKTKSNSAFTMAFLAAIQKPGQSWIFTNLKARIKPVRVEVIENLNILSSYSVRWKTVTPFRPGDFYRPSMKETSEAVPSDGNISSTDIADVLLHCIQIDEQHLAERIATRLLEASSHPQETIFRDILLPFLNYFLPVVKPVITTTTDTKTWDVTSFLKSFISPLLEQYIVRCVREEAAKQTPNWKRARVSCGCGDCDELNRFLISAIESTGRFKMGERRRDHLERQLQIPAGEYKLETERGKSPFTLVVRKGKDAATKERDAWMDRRREAEDFIRKLQRNGLSTVMGKDDIKAILSIGLSTSKPLSKANANQRKPVSLGPGAGSKHRLDQQGEENSVVIDLT